MLKSNVSPLPHWVLTDNHPSFYDSESVTAISMIAKIYPKIEELIADYERVVNELNETNTEAINYMKNNIIETTKNVFKDAMQEKIIDTDLINIYDSENESLVLKTVLINIDSEVESNG